MRKTSKEIKYYFFGYFCSRFGSHCWLWCYFILVFSLYLRDWIVCVSVGELGSHLLPFRNNKMFCTQNNQWVTFELAASPNPWTISMPISFHHRFAPVCLARVCLHSARQREKSLLCANAPRHRSEKLLAHSINSSCMYFLATRKRNKSNGIHIHIVCVCVCMVPLLWVHCVIHNVRKRQIIPSFASK